MGLGVRPPLAIDSCLCCVGLSSVIPSRCRPVLAADIILISRSHTTFITQDHVGHGQQCQQKVQHCQWKQVYFLVGCVVHDKMGIKLVLSPSYNFVSVRVEWNMFWPPVLYFRIVAHKISYFKFHINNFHFIFCDRRPLFWTLWRLTKVLWANKCLCYDIFALMAT